MDGSWDISQNPDEFFSKSMLIDLNDEICLIKEDNMFDQEILNNYAAANISCQKQARFSNRVTNQPKIFKLKPAPWSTTYLG